MLFHNQVSQLQIKPIAAAEITTVVAQPMIVTQIPFTRWPMIFLLPVISMMITIKVGTITLKAIAFHGIKFYLLLGMDTECASLELLLGYS